MAADIVGQLLDTPRLVRRQIVALDARLLDRDEIPLRAFEQRLQALAVGVEAPAYRLGLFRRPPPASPNVRRSWPRPHPPAPGSGCRHYASGEITEVMRRILREAVAHGKEADRFSGARLWGGRAFSEAGVEAGGRVSGCGTSFFMGTKWKIMAGPVTLDEKCAGGDQSGVGLRPASWQICHNSCLHTFGHPVANMAEVCLLKTTRASPPQNSERLLLVRAPLVRGGDSQPVTPSRPSLWGPEPSVFSPQHCCPPRPGLCFPACASRQWGLDVNGGDGNKTMTKDELEFQSHGARFGGWRPININSNIAAATTITCGRAVRSARCSSGIGHLPCLYHQYDYA